MTKEQPDYIVYLMHIRDSVDRIDEYLNGVDKETFLQTSLIQDAVIRQLEIIGEAVKQLPDRFREREDDIHWSEIAGMRDKLIHGYFSVDLKTVWLTTQKDIPTLKDRVDDLLSN